MIPIPTEEVKSKICLECGNCCKSMVVWFPAPLGAAPQVIEWMEARGIKRVPEMDRGSFMAGSLQNTCPHLKEGNVCDIYDKRPAACRKYDGRTDPSVVCYWKTYSV